MAAPRIKLIDNWRKAPRMLSMRIAGLAVAWGLLPPDQQAALLALVGLPVERIPAILGLLLIAGRLVEQPKVSGESADQPPAGG